MILGLHHAAIAVADIDAAVAFYCELIGFEIVMGAELPPVLELLLENPITKTDPYLNTPDAE